MNRRTFLKRTMAETLALAASGKAASAATGETEAPNIVLIMADDMGYSDIGCYGGEIRTPNIDRLAEGGVRFTSFYNAARCCPTRASLLTGLYPHQAGVGHMVYRDRGPGYRGRLNRRCVTIAEVVKTAGYRTMMTGKWHVGHDPGVWPSDRGFDRFYGIHKHVDSYWKVLRGCPVYLDGEKLIPPTDRPRNRLHPDREWYTTDVFTDYALKFVGETAKGPEPFFLYLAYNSPHWPLEAPQADVERYRGHYRGGWEHVRHQRFARMRQMGVLRPEWELPPDDAPEWESLSAADRRNLDFRRALYAAQVNRMDQNIGRLTNELERHGILENTLVLFWSDNGCSAEPERNMFGYRFEENRVQNFRDWRRDSGRSSSQGRAWANASNTPFRRYKRWTHEGGVATPLVAHWPAAVKGGREFVRQAAHVIDIMATCVDVADASYPESYHGHDIQPMEGRSLVPAFHGRQIEREAPLFWEHEGNWAVRDGKWKLVADGPGGERELYDMEADGTETHNLADRYPGRVKKVAEAWERWARERNVIPWPWKPKWGEGHG